MDSSHSIRKSLLYVPAAFAVLIAFFSISVFGQEQLVASPAPPPMKFIPSSERTQLAATHDAKGRLKSSIVLAEIRLLRAEQFTVDQNFIPATTELGIYQAIIEDLLRFLGLQKSDSNKTRDLYKRLEIQLRIHSTRIEAMRRVTPVAYAVHVKAIWEFSDSARAAALNAFFSDKVVPNRSEESENTTAVGGSPSVPAPTPEMQK